MRFPLAFLAALAACDADLDTERLAAPDPLQGAATGGSKFGLSHKPDVGPPPVLDVQAFCNDDACETMVLSAADSTHADSYLWRVNGKDHSTASEILLDLRGMEIPVLLRDGDDVEWLEQLPPSRFAEVQLVVSGGGQSESYTLALLKSPLVPTAEALGPDDPGSTIEGVVVLGVQDCSVPIVVTQFGGCLFDPTVPDITHTFVSGPLGGTPTPAWTTYDRTSGALTRLEGVGAAFQLDPDPTTLYTTPGVVYGSFRFRALAPPSAQHLTTYWSLSPQETAMVRVHHVYGTSNTSSTLFSVQVECAEDDRALVSAFRE